MNSVIQDSCHEFLTSPLWDAHCYDNVQFVTISMGPSYHIWGEWSNRKALSVSCGVNRSMSLLVLFLLVTDFY